MNLTLRKQRALAAMQIPIWRLRPAEAQQAQWLQLQATDGQHYFALAKATRSADEQHLIQAIFEACHWTLIAESIISIETLQAQTLPHLLVFGEIAGIDQIQNKTKLPSLADMLINKAAKKTCWQILKTFRVG